MFYSTISDLKVSIVGLGSVKFGRNTAVKYPQEFKIPSDKELQGVLGAAADCGINLLDTAPAYGSSEERIGCLLAKNKDWLIATKVGEVFDPITGQSSYDFTPEFIQASVRSSLKKLNRDCLDIVLVHSDGNDKAIISLGALDVLQQLKTEGLIRAVGMSTKTVEGGMLAVEQSDLVMVTHNVGYQAEVGVIEHASALGKGVLIKKALGSGHVTVGNPIEESFECVFHQEGVSSVIIGSINTAHILENVNHALRAKSNSIT